MRGFLAFISLLLLANFAGAADDLIGTSGDNQLVDNAGNRWNAHLKYTTNGNGDVYTLGGLVASDDYYGDNISGNHMLIDNNGRKWNARRD